MALAQLLASGNYRNLPATGAAPAQIAEYSLGCPALDGREKYAALASAIHMLREPERFGLAIDLGDSAQAALARLLYAALIARNFHAPVKDERFLDDLIRQIEARLEDGPCEPFCGCSL